MRDGSDNTWKRIERYRRDLIDLCDRVSGDMDRNRQVREEWHAYTRVWKRVWLEGVPKSVPRGPEPPSET